MAYPDVMSDILNTYLARHERDGYMGGDSCLITGTRGPNLRFSPVLAAQAHFGGVSANPTRLYAALKENFASEKYVAGMWTRGYQVEPAAGGFACSRSLEFDTGFHAMALQAKAQGDMEGAASYLRLSKSYTNSWDSANQAFRVKNVEGAWGSVEHRKMT